LEWMLARCNDSSVSSQLTGVFSQNELQQQGDAEVLADQCFVDARKMLDDVAPLVTVAVSLRVDTQAQHACNER
jgi:hypothetical protein